MGNFKRFFEANIAQEGFFDNVFGNKFIAEVRTTGFEIDELLNYISLYSDRQKYLEKYTKEVTYAVFDYLVPQFLKFEKDTLDKYGDEDNIPFGYINEFSEEIYSKNGKHYKWIQKTCEDIYNKKYKGNVLPKFKYSGSKQYSKIYELNISKYRDLYGAFNNALTGKSKYNNATEVFIILSDINTYVKKPFVKEEDWEIADKYIPSLEKVELKYIDGEYEQEFLKYLDEDAFTIFHDFVGKETFHLLGAMWSKYVNDMLKQVYDTKSDAYEKVDVRFYPLNEDWNSPNAIKLEQLFKDIPFTYKDYLKNSKKIVFTTKKYVSVK